VILATVLLLGGAVLVAAGAEGAVRSAGRLAASLGLPLFALGAVLFGMDLEGLGATLVASGRGETGLATGTALGTVLFVGGFAFGAALLVAPKPVPSPGTLMAIAPALPLAGAGMALYDGMVGRLEGGMLVAIYAGYVALVISEGRAIRAAAAERREALAGASPSRLRSLGATTASLAGLWLGAWLLVQGGVRVLEGSGLRAGFVGAAVVATLAGLDEILLEVVPVRRGRPHLATGNLFGTVAAFASAVLGLAALVHPLASDGAADLALVAGTALYAVTAAVFLLRGRAGRILGVFLVAAYVAWLAVTWSL
jgi:cation:H+ antiporter